MHPDQATYPAKHSRGVSLALQQTLVRAWLAYLAGWEWYVRSGYAPPGSRELPRARSPRAEAAPPPRPGGRVVFTAGGALQGARLGLPFVAGSLGYGVVFGVLARQAGMSVWEATLMSATVAAGAAQMVALGLWHHPLPVVAIVLLTLLVNLRHLLFGAAVAPWLSGLSAPRRYGSAFFLADESWTLAMSRFREGERDAAVLPGSGAAILAGWVAGTAAGHLLGRSVPDPAAWGLDFLITATFLTLLVAFWEGRRRHLLPWAVAGGVAVAAAGLLPPGWHVALGGIAGSVAGGLARAE